MRVMDKLMQGYARGKDPKGSDVYGKKLLPYSKVKIFFSPKLPTKEKNKE